MNVEEPREGVGRAEKEIDLPHPVGGASSSLGVEEEDGGSGAVGLETSRVLFGG